MKFGEGILPVVDVTTRAMAQVSHIDSHESVIEAELDYQRD